MEATALLEISQRLKFAEECLAPFKLPWRRGNVTEERQRLEHLIAKDRVQEGRPFAFKAPGATETELICLNPRAGTAWKLALVAALQPDGDLFSLLKSRPRVELPPPPSTVEMLRSRRFVFVRNPYDRLISTYLAFEKGSAATLEGPGDYVRGDGFAAFVGNLTRLDGASDDLNPHFRPQSQLCGLPMGMSFDYVLKLEDMARWYEPFSRLLGITDVVQDPAWNTSGREWRGGKPCFYTPPKVRCSDLFDDDVAACAAVGDATADEEFGEADAGLAAGSGVGLRKWYYTSDLLIKQATGWLINDLRTFGYKPMRR